MRRIKGNLTVRTLDTSVMRYRVVLCTVFTCDVGFVRYLAIKGNGKAVVKKDRRFYNYSTSKQTNDH